MKKLRFYYVFTILLTLFALNLPALPSDIRSAIDSLDVALDKQESVITRRLEAIDSLKRSVLKSGNADLALVKSVADKYRGVNIDSAVTYYSKVLSAPNAEADSNFYIEVKYEYARQIAKAGLFTEALVLIGSAPADNHRGHYYDVKSQILINAARFHPLAEAREAYIAMAVTSLDSLANMWPRYTVAHKITKAQQYMFDNNPTLAEGELLEVVDSLDVSSPAFAVAASILSNIHKDNPGKEDEYLYYLILSAISDAKSGNRETYSLQRLGNELFKRGDYDHAYRYISTAGESLQQVEPHDYVYDNHMTIRTLLDSVNMNEHKQRTVFTFTTLLLAIILVVFMISMTLYFLRWRNTESRIKECDARMAAKDNYIHQLLLLCYANHEGLEEFNRLINRKLKVGQVQDVLSLTESGSAMSDQTRKFYTAFDKAILNIFPDFPGKLNELFQSDKKMEVSEDGKLNPAQRIAALLRLGITDSTQISKLLGLSLNTVYTYRNRMKSRAISKDSFEDDVLKIGSEY